jgi:hypothetical protein
MSSSTDSRIALGPAPGKPLTRNNYRKEALAPLRRHLADRCAYSCKHLTRAGGVKCMEVDHFDPRTRDKFRQNFQNLFLASRHCDGAKRDCWPTGKDQALGLRFLNPCQERDYGPHILEDPQPHLLIGTTPPGPCHIRMCDLNADHLIEERREWARIWALLRHSAFVVRHGHAPEEATRLSPALRELAEKRIPEFPHLPTEMME